MNLLQSLPQSVFSVPADGLIESILKNSTLYGGQDITHTIATHRTQSKQWKSEADCLLDVIKVGEIDTKSVGCIASDVVLYTSLIVILGVILVKFGLAVVFGWFLSWKLGNFKKEGRSSYKDRMQRDDEIEDWTTGIHVPAEAIRPRYNPYSSASLKKKSIIPKTSRFTQPDTGSTHFNTLERPGSTIWKQSVTGYINIYELEKKPIKKANRYITDLEYSIRTMFVLPLRDQLQKMVEVQLQVLYLVDRHNQ